MFLAVTDDCVVLDWLLPMAAETVGPAVALPQFGGTTWNVIGSGWSSYRDALLAKLTSPPQWDDGECFPQAIDVALLAAADLRAGRAVPAEEALPVYLRDKVALTLAEQAKQRG